MNSDNIRAIKIRGVYNTVDDANKAFLNGADGVVGGSFFVYYGKHNAILISYPSEEDLLNI